jgi:hypothetical protein
MNEQQFTDGRYLEYDGDWMFIRNRLGEVYLMFRGMGIAQGIGFRDVDLDRVIKHLTAMCEAREQQSMPLIREESPR